MKELKEQIDNFCRKLDVDAKLNKVKRGDVVQVTDNKCSFPAKALCDQKPCADRDSIVVAYLDVQANGKKYFCQYINEKWVVKQ